MQINPEILLHPFTLGLALGLTLSVYVFLNGRTKVKLARQQLREARNETSKLKDHLHTQMTINATGNQKISDENTQLKERINNLEVSFTTLQSKPGKAEQIQLAIYEKSVRILNQEAPGFAASWENAFQRAEEEFKQSQKGIIPFIKKVFHPNSITESSESKKLEE